VPMAYGDHVRHGMRQPPARPCGWLRWSLGAPQKET
jgi:hypothetical protein